MAYLLAIVYVDAFLCGFLIEITNFSQLHQQFVQKNRRTEQIASTKVSKLLEGYRGEAPCDVEEVREAIKRVARLTLD
ncbi:MAG: acetate--CoA ligase family protein, partial [Prevotella sp.]|nr:acetate--CoA ligase family protein [Prevotella sp.]